jgi:carbonic anhydrase
MQEPLTMSAEQLATLTAIYDNNNRPVQPLNDREIDRVSL